MPELNRPGNWIGTFIHMSVVLDFQRLNREDPGAGLNNERLYTSDGCWVNPHSEVEISGSRAPVYTLKRSLKITPGITNGLKTWYQILGSRSYENTSVVITHLWVGVSSSRT